jgi:hypothetical protein
LFNETQELIEKGEYKLHIHPLAKLTTPFDVWQNRTTLKSGARNLWKGDRSNHEKTGNSL